MNKSIVDRKQLRVTSTSPRTNNQAPPCEIKKCNDVITATAKLWIPTVDALVVELRSPAKELRVRITDNVRTAIGNYWPLAARRVVTVVEGYLKNTSRLEMRICGECWIMKG
jgi:hypothetical protein